MQYDRDAGGKLTPLPRPSIDTGMGLERTAAVLQGKISNYDTDLLLPIIHRGAELFGNVAYGSDPKVDTALRIAADHARSTAFLIHDGVLPSNEGRGYVLRKIMRRAMRHARMVGVEQPFLYELTGFVAELMRPGYPELMESVQRVARVVKDEEHRYATTFLVAEKMFSDEVKASLANGRLPGDCGFQALRHLRPGARRAGRHGAGTRPRPSIARASSARWTSSAVARAPAGRARRKDAVAPAYQIAARKGPYALRGLRASETHARVIGLLIDQQPVDHIEPGTACRAGAG